MPGSPVPTYTSTWLDATLLPYLPRLAAEWDLDAPGASWRSLDATCCFVDISGFTALSERLARRGRIGAEELTEVLNHVFRARQTPLNRIVALKILAPELAASDSFRLRFDREAKIPEHVATGTADFPVHRRLLPVPRAVFCRMRTTSFSRDRTRSRCALAV